MPEGRLSKQVLNTHGLEVRWYRPTALDPQTPHDRDEVYVVVSGA
jgi:mannose-6-phosphate isomerase-like protein (cupin superfamily)